MTPTQAKCALENVTVHLNLPVEENVMYFPTCIRLPRCSGCCVGQLLKCQPSSTKTHTYKVKKHTYMVKKHIYMVKKHTYMVKKHTYMLKKHLQGKEILSR